MVQLVPHALAPTARTGPAVNDRVRVTFLKSTDEIVRGIITSKNMQRRYTVPKERISMSISFDQNKEEHWKISILQVDEKQQLTPFVMPIDLGEENVEFNRKLAMKEMNPKLIKMSDEKPF